jgi:arylsulfatase A-like enzyme
MLWIIRYGWLLITITMMGAAHLPLHRAHAKDAARPNILLIVSDDQGYGDLGCYPGNKKVSTPNLDRLARQGVRMTDAYSADPVCSPSRASLLTGRYGPKFGYYGNWDSQAGLPVDVRTAPRYLKDLGYRTALIGKWHLGHTPAKHPLNRGFDRFFGILGGQHDYFDPDRGAAWSAGPHHVLFTYDQWERVDKLDYMTSALTREAVDFISRDASKPFFLFLSYTANHAPLQVPDRYLDRYEGEDISNARKKVRAMIRIMDQGIGRVLETLKKRDMADNTLVLFIGDNGGLGGPSDNWHFRASKGRLSEGGIRVPWIARWPGNLPQGKVYRKPIHHIDVLPTILAATDHSRPDTLDGVNLLPYWRGDKTGMPHETLYWDKTPGSGKRWAIRQGSWKLVNEIDGIKGLFHLSRDPDESNNLSDKYPQVRKRLREKHQSWQETNRPRVVNQRTRAVNQWELRYRREMRGPSQ